MPTPPSRIISLHYNNIAWLRCRDWRSKEYNLGEAQAMMDHLLSALPESEWLPEFPEYFHTKACIAFEEFRACKAQVPGAPEQRDWLAQKLEEAEEALRKALGALELDDWAALARQISHERRALAKANQAESAQVRTSGPPLPGVI
jgi:hypothetical protein